MKSNTVLARVDKSFYDYLRSMTKSHKKTVSSLHTSNKKIFRSVPEASRYVKKCMEERASGFWDMIFIFGIFILLGVVGALGLFILTSLLDGLSASATTVGAQTIIGDASNMYKNVFDGALILVFFGLWIASLISAFYLDSSPIYYVVFLSVSLVAILGLMPFSEMLTGLFNDPGTLGDFMNTYLPMTKFIANNIGIFLALFIVSQTIALYLRTRISGGGFYEA
jgi:MFS family permease